MIKPLVDGASTLPPHVPADPPQDAETAGLKAGEVGDAITRQLKDLYDQVSAEPVPDKHRKLLEELEQKSGKETPTK